MKTNINILFSLSLILVTMIGCGEEKEPVIHTCPMHPQVVQEGPGQCPICHMDLVPQKKPATKESETGPNVEKSKSDTDSMLHISSEFQQLSGIRTKKAKLGEMVSEIETTGRAAFDPELGVAVKEYLLVLGDPALAAAARSRLRLLGMGEDEIRDLTRRPSAYESLYTAKSTGNIWIYATVYENETHLIEKGMKAEIRTPGSQKLTGIVRSQSPVVDASTRSVNVRIEVPGGAAKIRPESYVSVRIDVPAKRSVIIPRSALVDTGTKQYVFVMKDNDHFQLRPVRAGMESEDQVQILSGLEEGEEVVSTGTFLIDSEAKLKNVEFSSPKPESKKNGEEKESANETGEESKGGSEP